MTKELQIGNKRVGDGRPVFLIAEAGVNHNGDLDMAYRLIDAAVTAGADAVKFQTFLTEEVVSPETPLAGHHVANVGKTISHFDLIKKIELPPKSFKELKAYCERKRIIFISTPYDVPSTRLLLELGCDTIKIASSEMSNFPMLDVVRSSGVNVILSTGMSQWQEIVDVVQFLKEKTSNICILKCTSNYPASAESIHLKGINKIYDSFPDCCVGFSDHSVGNHISLASLGFDVCMIERHFTLDKEAWGPDHKASMTPAEFRQFVDDVRLVEKALGKYDWDVQDEERTQRRTMQKGAYTRKAMKKGCTVTLDDVKFLRPTGSITPKEFFLKFQQRPLAIDVGFEQELKPEHFEKQGSG
jgi:sialic acid synthase SpsE